MCNQKLCSVLKLVKIWFFKFQILFRPHPPIFPLSVNENVDILTFWRCLRMPEDPFSKKKKTSRRFLYKNQLILEKTRVFFLIYIYIYKDWNFEWMNGPTSRPDLTLKSRNWNRPRSKKINKPKQKREKNFDVLTIWNKVQEMRRTRRENPVLL